MLWVSWCKNKYFWKRFTFNQFSGKLVIDAFIKISTYIWKQTKFLLMHIGTYYLREITDIFAYIKKYVVVNIRFIRSTKHLIKKFRNFYKICIWLKSIQDKNSAQCSRPTPDFFFGFNFYSQKVIVLNTITYKSRLTQKKIVQKDWCYF